jgi:hypothetical protein
MNDQCRCFILIYASCLGLGNIIQVYIDFLFEGSWLFIKEVYIFVTTWFIFCKNGKFLSSLHSIGNLACSNFTYSPNLFQGFPLFWCFFILYNLFQYSFISNSVEMVYSVLCVLMFYFLMEFISNIFVIKSHIGIQLY